MGKKIESVYYNGAAVSKSGRSDEANVGLSNMTTKLIVQYIWRKRGRIKTFLE